MSVTSIFNRIFHRDQVKPQWDYATVGKATNNPQAVQHIDGVAYPVKEPHEDYPSAVARMQAARIGNLENVPTTDPQRLVMDSLRADVASSRAALQAAYQANTAVHRTNLEYRRQITHLNKAVLRHKRRAAGYREAAHAANSESNSGVHQRSRAWMAICDVLSSIRPTWAREGIDRGEPAVVSAERVIRELADSRTITTTTVRATTDAEYVAFLKEQVAAGATIQTWWPEGYGDGKWVDAGAPKELSFMLPAHYYRVKPAADADTTGADNTQS